MKAGDGSSDGITMANKPVRGVKAESMQMVSINCVLSLHNHQNI